MAEQKRAKVFEWIELSEKILQLSKLTEIHVDSVNLDITLSQVMTAENRADMLAYMEKNERKGALGSAVLAVVMHDINGFKQEHLSDSPTGFLPRTDGHAKEKIAEITERRMKHIGVPEEKAKEMQPIENFSEGRPHVIVFVSGGLVQSVSSTDSSILVDVADKDCADDGSDPVGYLRLVQLAESVDYKGIY